MEILRKYAEFIPKIFNDCRIINVCLHKKDFPPETDFLNLAFARLITRYDLFLTNTVKDEGMIISDESNETALRNLLRKMRIDNLFQSPSDDTYNTKITG